MRCVPIKTAEQQQAALAAVKQTGTEKRGLVSDDEFRGICARLQQPGGNPVGARKRSFLVQEVTGWRQNDVRRRCGSITMLCAEVASAGRFTAAPSPSKNIRRAEGAARRIEATEISSGCRSGSRGSNRAAESGRTVYRARLRQPHRGRRTRARRLGYIRLTAQRGGVAPSSPPRETPATRRRPLLTGSLSGSFSCSTSCVFRFPSGLPRFFRPCKFDRHGPHRVGWEGEKCLRWS